MTVGVVIFSRLDSKRLPGKALRTFGGWKRPLLGRVIDRILPRLDSKSLLSRALRTFGGPSRPLLGHVIDRAKSAKTPDMVIVATSDRPTDDPIAAFAKREGVKVFRGSALDVLGRGLACAEAFQLTALGRFCGDSPFMPPEVIDRLIAIHEKEQPEITTNVFPRSYPMGMTFEIISIDALRHLAGLTDDPYDREHMTSYIYKHADEFRIRNVESDPKIDNWDGWPLTVDSLSDLSHANYLSISLRESHRRVSLKNVLELTQEYRQTTKKDLALQKREGT